MASREGTKILAVCLQGGREEAKRGAKVPLGSSLKAKATKIICGFSSLPERRTSQFVSPLPSLRERGQLKRKCRKYDESVAWGRFLWKYWGTV